MPTDSSKPRFWAKASDDGLRYHPLIAHSADVAAVTWALTAPGGALFECLGRAAGDPAEPKSIQRVLTYLAALHDIGKTSHGFQDKAGPWKHKGPSRWVASGHVLPLVRTVTARLHAATWFGLVDALPWGKRDLADMLLTSICHHGRPWTGRGSRPADRLEALWTVDPASGRRPLEEIGRIAEAARRWTEVSWGQGSPPPFVWTPELANLFAGLLVTADWIGSSTSIFEFDPGAEEDPDDYWERSLEKARRALCSIGIRPPIRRLRSEGTDIYALAFPEVFGGSAEPTGLQQELASMELPAPGSRVVVESETGSGKTEGILALYLRLRDAGRVDGLVFALPTRATARAMQNRIQECLEALYPPDERPTLALAMGGEAATARDSTPLGSEGERYEDVADRALRRWATESAKRFFAAEVVVGTVDQVLLAGLPVRHAHQRLGLLARHLLVVDELHSYDRYMTTVLRSVVDILSGVGGVSAFLSATLAREERHRLTGDADISSLAEACSEPYPSISIHAGGAWSLREVSPSDRSRTLSWNLTSWGTGMDQAVRLARKGARVCILRNTVKDARQTAEALRQRAGDLLWGPEDAEEGTALHSRYIPGDRAVLDQAVLNDFGRRPREGSGVILVSTQIVEQSLDVDFDWMLTDLAPIDVLLQRAGRVHRHEGRERPSGAEKAAMGVHAPPDGFEARPGSRGPHGWGTVYPGIVDLELTRRCIARQSEVDLPAMNRALIEGVFHSDAREELVAGEPEWEDVCQREIGRVFGEDLHGRQAVLDFTRSYMDLADRFSDAEEERIRTRIGDDQVVVALDRSVRGHYAIDAVASELPLALRKLRKAELPAGTDPQASWTRDDEDGPVFSLGVIELKYGLTGWLVAES